MAAEKRSLRGMAYASMFVTLTTVGAYIKIPFPSVPITMQTLFVSITGALLGGYLGALSTIYTVRFTLPIFPHPLRRNDNQRHDLSKECHIS